MRLLLDTHILLAIIHKRTTELPLPTVLAQCEVEGMRLVTIDRALVSHRLSAR